MRRAAVLLGSFAAAVLFTAAAHAIVIVPSNDDEVIDVLPAVAGGRAEARRLRNQLAQRPNDAVLALAAASRDLAEAHASGDPRFAGQALAALAAWTDETTMPDELLMMRAVLQQYLHEFDVSAASLKRLLARRSGATNAQAWLTLATVRRVQGRYGESDAACAQVARAGAALHANACAAENLALRGRVERAREMFANLLADGRQPPATRAWLLTSVAELEQRDGRAGAAAAAFRRALALASDPYTTLAYADLLIEQKQPAQALALLKGQVRSDAVLLRLAIAGTRAHAPDAAADVAEMRERIALANERPDAKLLHGREQAMFALAVDHDATRALALARGNVAQQREPLDLWVFAAAAQASGDASAREDAARLSRDIGIVDKRVQALQ